jgi:hypothetical protein
MPGARVVSWCIHQVFPHHHSSRRPSAERLCDSDVCSRHGTAGRSGYETDARQDHVQIRRIANRGSSCSHDHQSERSSRDSAIPPFSDRGTQNRRFDRRSLELAEVLVCRQDFAGTKNSARTNVGPRWKKLAHRKIQEVVSKHGA